MTAEAMEILALISTAAPEKREAMTRAALLYVTGTDYQRQQLDRIATERPTWPECLQILHQAETVPA